MISEKREIISLAPGRVCLFGDHQDYLELPIIACAINRYIQLTATENNTEYFNINKVDINKKKRVHIHQEYEVLASGDYIASGLKVTRKYGCVPTAGYDIIISGNVAINSGTSSSSALIISWIQFLFETFGCNEPITSELISKVAYEAEVLEHYSSGGRMDQYSIGMGDIIYLETDENAFCKKIGSQLNGLIVAESGIPKPTLSLLKELKEKAQISLLKVKQKVKDFDVKKVKEKDIPLYAKYLSDDLQPYFYAAIANHCTTLEALQEFEKLELDTERIGELMTKHHNILKNYLDLTVPRIDDMINAALKAGAYGAKIVGSGRGGCIVILSPEGKEQQIIKKVNEAGAVNAYQVTVDAGARIIKSPILV